MSYIPMGLLALLIVAADQISKYFVVERIAYGSAVPLLVGFFIPAGTSIPLTVRRCC